MSERGITDRHPAHHDNCWLDGPEHYLCAMWKVSQLSIALVHAAALVPDAEKRTKFADVAINVQEAMLMTNYKP